MCGRTFNKSYYVNNTFDGTLGSAMWRLTPSLNILVTNFSARMSLLRVLRPQLPACLSRMVNHSGFLHSVHSREYSVIYRGQGFLAYRELKIQIQGGKNWIFPKEINANRFFRDSHWLENLEKPLLSLSSGLWTSQARPSTHR